MPLVGLSEAARLTGKHSTTILRATARGRLSASTNAAGQRVFDTAELDRVYGVKPSNGIDAGAAADAGQRSPAQLRETELLTQRVAEQSEVIRDLWARLDVSEAERRRLSERLTGLLTSRQAGSVPSVPAPRAPWWRRWFR